MIRRATEHDFHTIVVMASEFWQHTIFDDEFDYDTVFAMVSECHGQQLLCVAEEDGEIIGFAAGVQGRLLGNGSIKVGVEVAWWVDPSHRGGVGIKLLKFIEKLARAQGIKYWTMVYMLSSMPEIVQKIYERLGYTAAEVSYIKRL